MRIQLDNCNSFFLFFCLILHYVYAETPVVAAAAVAAVFPELHLLKEQLQLLQHFLQVTLDCWEADLLEFVGEPIPESLGNHMG